MAMTRARFRRLVLNFANGFGENYLLNTEDTELNTLIDEQLKLFTDRTRCLYDDKISFTLILNTDEYSMRNTAVFTQELTEVTAVMINGQFIPRARSQDMKFINSAYILADSNLPKVWFMSPRHSLVLYPKPDQVYSNCFVSAWYLQPDLTSDSDATLIPEEYDRTAAQFTALALFRPGKGSVEALTYYRDLKNETEADMKLLRERSDSLISRDNYRKGRRTGHTLA